jgi:hypothetical protein
VRSLDALVPAVIVAAAAQETTGAVTGAVTDGEGRRLPGVTVRVTDPSTGFAREQVTPLATYAITLLPPGRYDVTFALRGFARYTVRSVPLHVNDRLTVNAVLGTAEVDRRWRSGERAAAPGPAVQFIVTPPQVEALPLADRSFVPLVALVPGMTLDGEPGISGRAMPTIGGAPPRASGWFLDGAPIAGSGGLILTPTLESIEEVRVIASTPSAEWPRGAVVNVVTRAGTNTLRASAYELHRDDRLDANAFLRNSSLDPQERGNPPRLREDTFGYTAGGPIRKDALFFFWSQEWRRRRGASAADGLETRQEVARVDHLASPRWRLMGRYTHDVVDAGEARATGNLLVAQAGTAISATTRNEASYRMAEGGSGRSHTVADDLSLQRGAHTWKVGGLVAHEAALDRYEAYAQDWWRVHREATVDLGLRYAEKGLGPRLGVTWSPRARSGTRVRGGFGVYRGPRPIRHWSLGLARTLYGRGTLDVAYAGASGNGEPDPARTRYHGLLAAFRHEGPAGLLDLSYTLSRNRAGADRPHVFTASYVRAVGGWRIAGITTFQSGPPMVLVDDAGAPLRTVGDPFTHLPSDRYYFSPAAFAPPPVSAPGTPRSAFRLPGRNQWDIAVSRGFPLHGGARLQLRADAFNLFNHTQFTEVDVRCSAGPADTTCAVPNTTFGQYTATRPPRQVQLGVKLLWN